MPSVPPHNCAASAEHDVWHALATAAVAVGRLERQKHDPWTAAMASTVPHSSAHLIQIQIQIL